MKGSNAFFYVYTLFAIVVCLQYVTYEKQYKISYEQGYEDAQFGRRQEQVRPQPKDYLFQIKKAAHYKGYAKGYNAGSVPRDAEELRRARHEQQLIDQQGQEAATAFELKNQALVDELDQPPLEPVGYGASGSFVVQEVVTLLIPEEAFPIESISSNRDDVDVWIRAASVDEVRKFISCVRDCVLFQNVYMAIAKSDPSGEGVLAEVFFKKSPYSYKQVNIDGAIRQTQQRLQQVRFESPQVLAEKDN